MDSGSAWLAGGEDHSLVWSVLTGSVPSNTTIEPQHCITPIVLRGTHRGGYTSARGIRTVTVHWTPDTNY